MKKESFKKLQFFFLLLSAVSVEAQSNWNWPEDKKTAQSYHARYTDAYSLGNYKEAVEPLEWLIKTVPNLNKSLYQHGELMYTNLVKEEEDPNKKRAYEDRAIEMLSLREKYFGESNVVYNRRAILSYKFYRDRPEKLEETYKVLLRAIELNGKKIFAPNLVATMDVARRLKRSGKVFSQDSIISLYALVNGLISLKKENIVNDKTKPKRLDRLSRRVSKIFESIVKIDCNLIETILAPQTIARAKKDTTTESSRRSVKYQLRALLRLIRDHSCGSSKLELEVYRLLYDADPSSEFAIVLARKFLSEKNDVETAFRYYEEALSYSKERKERASIYLDMAKLEAQKGNKSSSRSYARKAIKENEELLDAYALIGSLYMGSYEECKKGVSRVSDRAIFIAAHNMFKKAGRSKMMSEAEVLFPTVEQIFELGLSEGTEITIECWVQEKVILVKAPN